MTPEMSADVRRLQDEVQRYCGALLNGVLPQHPAPPPFSLSQAENIRGIHNSQSRARRRQGGDRAENEKNRPGSERG